MKKMNFLLQIFATLCIVVATSTNVTAQIYQKKTTPFKVPTTTNTSTSESCNCSIAFYNLSEYCKNKCRESFSEIVIHDNISIGTGNPHGNENPWLMRVGPGKLPFLQVGKEGGIGLGTTLFPLQEGEVDLGSNKKPFRQISALKFAEISDRREKENIIDLTYGLKDVLKLKPVSFTWKSKAIEGTQVGLIAQEVQEVIPEVVISQEFTTNNDGNQVALTTDRLSVAYSELIPVLIHAIQEQQQIIEAQKQQMGQQATTIDGMEATVSQLIEALEAQGIQTQKAKTETSNSK